LAAQKVERCENPEYGPFKWILQPPPRESPFYTAEENEEWERIRKPGRWLILSVGDWPSSLDLDVAEQLTKIKSAFDAILTYFHWEGICDTSESDFADVFASNSESFHKKLIDELSAPLRDLRTLTKQAARVFADRARKLAGRTAFELSHLETVTAHDDWPPPRGWGFRPGSYSYNGKAHPLYGKGLQLLKRLADARGIAIPIGTLKEDIWPDVEIEDATVRSWISKLRMKLRRSLKLRENEDPIICVDDMAYRLIT
jgi:hypothetical protein